MPLRQWERNAMRCAKPCLSENAIQRGMCKMKSMRLWTMFVEVSQKKEEDREFSKDTAPRRCWL